MLTPVSTSSSIILAKDSSAALGGVGFPLYSGNSQTLYTRAQVYAYNPGIIPIQVSVAAELYAPEKLYV